MGYGSQALKLLYSYYHGDMVCEDTPTDTSITSTDQQQVRLHISLKIILYLIETIMKCNGRSGKWDIEIFHSNFTSLITF